MRIKAGINYINVYYTMIRLADTFFCFTISYTVFTSVSSWLSGVGDADMHSCGLSAETKDSGVTTLLWSLEC